MTLTRVLAVVVALGFSSATFAAAEVACKDGTTSRGGRGACSGHGGVAKKATAKRAGKEAKKTEKKAGGEAQSLERKGREEAEPGVSTAPRERSSAARPQGRAPSASRSEAREPSAGSRNPQNTDPTGAIAQCRDGTYSHAKSHSGACSRHGGVGEWLDAR